jgi:tetratricopeptide (TPR) repeat protein
MIRRRLLLFSVVLGLLVPCSAQRRGGSTGSLSNSRRTVDLTIRVSYPNDRPVEQGLEVSLVAPQGGIVQQSFTDDVGSAPFHGITPGRYRLRITGVDIESADLPAFEINSLESVHYEYVHVTPRADSNANAKGAGAAGMISAAELNIPDKAKKEFDRGLEAMQKPDDPKALEHFEKATVLYPQYAQAYNNIGVVEIRSGHPVQARQAFETSASLNPKNASSYLNLARMSLGEKNYTDADKLINKALTAEPNRVDAVALEAQTKLMLGDLDAAYAFAKKVHSMGEHKNYAVAHLICARVLQERHQSDQAMAEYKLFLEESPNSPSAPKVREAMAQLSAAGK